jgi:hypothetical protein
MTPATPNAPHAGQRPLQQPPQAPQANVGSPQRPRVVDPAPALPSPEELYAELKDWFLSLERSLAGYGHLRAALATFNGQVPDGARQKGLPILTFKASIDGRTAVEVVADLKNLPPQHVQHVLVPLLNMQASDLYQALDEVAYRATALRDQIGGQIGVRSQAPAPAGEDENANTQR